MFDVMSNKIERERRTHTKPLLILFSFQQRPTHKSSTRACETKCSTGRLVEKTSFNENGKTCQITAHWSVMART